MNRGGKGSQIVAQLHMGQGQIADDTGRSLIALAIFKIFEVE